MKKFAFLVLFVFIPSFSEDHSSTLLTNKAIQDLEVFGTDAHYNCLDNVLLLKIDGNYYFTQTNTDAGKALLSYALNKKSLGENINLRYLDSDYQKTNCAGQTIKWIAMLGEP